MYTHTHTHAHTIRGAARRSTPHQVCVDTHMYIIIYTYFFTHTHTHTHTHPTRCCTTRCATFSKFSKTQSRKNSSPPSRESCVLLNLLFPLFLFPLLSSFFPFPLFPISERTIGLQVVSIPPLPPSFPLFFFPFPPFFPPSPILFS